MVSARNSDTAVLKSVAIDWATGPLAPAKNPEATLDALRASQEYVAAGRAFRQINYQGDSTMVMLTAAGPVMVYRVLDKAGQAIGEVVQPRSRPILAPGA